MQRRAVPSINADACSSISGTFVLARARRTRTPSWAFTASETATWASSDTQIPKRIHRGGAQFQPTIHLQREHDRVLRDRDAAKSCPARSKSAESSPRARTWLE